MADSIFSFDPDTFDMTFTLESAGNYTLYFAILSYGDTIQDYLPVDVSVCGEETLVEVAPIGPVSIKLDY